jgi:S1-C subfamily serine protease
MNYAEMVAMGSVNTFVVLVDELADLIPDLDKARLVVTAVGLKPRLIKWEGTPQVRWASILEVAEEHSKLVEVVERAVADYPKHRYLIEVASGSRVLSRGPDVDWKGLSFEAIVGTSDLLPIRYLAIGLRRAESVGRIVRTDGTLGTGFIVDGNVLVTNHHVLPNAEIASTAKLQLGYELSEAGALAEAEALALAPALGFATSEEHDWAAVRLAGDRTFPSIPLPPKSTAVGARVAIIQHPGGEPKQIALHDSEVAFVSDTRVQYLADTRAGSSGSPVFDVNWNLVAVHHSGGTFRDTSTARNVQRNEGIVAHLVIDAMRAARVLKAS